MAVTQQLARADEALVEACRRDVSLLDDLCSFRLLAQMDHMDLDWAPSFLEAVAKAAAVPQVLREGLRAATSGGTELNAAYRDVPYGIFEHPVTFLTPPRVAEVAVMLRSLADTDFINRSSISAALAQVPEGPSSLLEYASLHFERLVTFYEGAAERGLCTLMWWD